MKEKLIYLYYLALLVILVSWQNVDVAPSMALRIPFMLAVVIPAALKKGWLPIVLACFITVTVAGFASSYLPSRVVMYFLMSAIGFVIVRTNNQLNQNVIPTPAIVMLVCMTVIDLVTSFSIEDHTYAFLILLMLIKCTDTSDCDYVQKLALGFSVASIVVSSSFLLFRDMFASMYADGLERTEWMDANYFGIILGMGCITSISELFRGKKLKPLLRYIYIAAIVLTIPVLILNASRGAILSLSAGLLVILLFAKVKPAIKILAIAAITLFCVYLYTNSYFDLLIYRTENLQGGTVTNGRVDIWKSKLSYFWQEGNVFNWFFGFGYQGGANLGGFLRGFHNDFVAVFVDYGLVGLIIFLSFITFPIRKGLAINKKNVPLLASFAFFVVCMFSLEPFSLASTPFYIFYTYLLTSAERMSNEVQY